MHQEKAYGCGSKHQNRVGNATNGRTANGSLVGELDSWGESSGVGGINVRGDVGGRLDGVIACDIDRTDEGVEVASGNVVRVIPIDHASSPLDGARRGSRDTGGPYTSVGT